MVLQYDMKYKLVVRAYKNGTLITCGSSVFTTKSEYHVNAEYKDRDFSEYQKGADWKYYGQPLDHFNNIIIYF